MSRKSKAKPVSETEHETLARIVEERVAAARYSFKHGLRENETDVSNLIRARFNLARHIAISLNHQPLKQGISYECYRCGASGTFDVEAIGEIFNTECRS